MINKNRWADRDVNDSVTPTTCFQNVAWNFQIMLMYFNRHIWTSMNHRAIISLKMSPSKIKSRQMSVNSGKFRKPIGKVVVVIILLFVCNDNRNENKQLCVHGPSHAQTNACIISIKTYTQHFVVISRFRNQVNVLNINANTVCKCMLAALISADRRRYVLLLVHSLWLFRTHLRSGFISRLLFSGTMNTLTLVVSCFTPHVRN